MDVASKLSSKDEELLFTLRFKWLEPETPQKPKNPLERLLQSWFNKQKVGINCSVINIQGDGTAQIKMYPFPALTELQKLTKETLSSKDGKMPRVQILSFTLGSPKEDASVAIRPSSVSVPLQDEQVLMEGQSISAAVPTGGETHTCSLPVSHFWYVSHIYQEEIKRIEKETGVKIDADVKVAFKASQKDGSPATALSEFINLAQKSLGVKRKHEFCKDCMSKAVETMGPICPLCKDVFGTVQGDQPDGKMTSTTQRTPLPGFPGCGTIVINYDIPAGTQTEIHPNPGQRYSGIRRVAYLPDNREGKEVLQLLKRAFDQKLIFTIGTSRTTGLDNQVTWNDILHKTSMTGGQQSYGYPDPDYLSRVREELKAKGIE